MHDLSDDSDDHRSSSATSSTPNQYPSPKKDNRNPAAI